MMVGKSVSVEEAVVMSATETVDGLVKSVTWVESNVTFVTIYLMSLTSAPLSVLKSFGVKQCWKL